MQKLKVIPQSETSNFVTAVLYKENQPNCDVMAHLVLFVATSNPDIDKLLAYKQQVNARYLIAIVTDEQKDIEASLAIADKVIYCEPDAVDNVAESLNRITSDNNFINIDIDDIFTCFTYTNSAYLIWHQTTLDQLNDLTDYSAKIQALAGRNLTPKGIINHITASSDFNFVDQEKVAQVAESLDGTWDHVFYGILFKDPMDLCIINTLVFC